MRELSKFIKGHRGRFCFALTIRNFFKLNHLIINNLRTTMERKNELYYDAMELLCEEKFKEAKKLLLDALKIDEHFVDAYVGLTSLYRASGNFKKEKKYADIGYEITKDKFSKWPKRMEWGIMDNRAYMRSICDKATTSQISGDYKTADKLYRLLLKMNPNDNQGIRYLIAGMFEGKEPYEVDEMFDTGNEKQNWSNLEKMVIKQNKKHKFWKD